MNDSTSLATLSGKKANRSGSKDAMHKELPASNIFQERRQ